MEEHEIQGIFKVNKTSQAGGLMDKKLFLLKDYFFTLQLFLKEDSKNLWAISLKLPKELIYSHICASRTRFPVINGCRIRNSTRICIYSTYFVSFFLHMNICIYMYMYMYIFL